ncbi:MAG TPA: DUF4230 domain-containing protein [Gaiellaceae bacterium]|nr:DUF4230 domain-containing protein [Gaiellaceae bacterium]
MGVISRVGRQALPLSPAPAPVVVRERSRFPWGAILLLLVVVLLLVGGRDWLPNLIPSLPNPFAAKTVDRSGPAVLKAIEDLNEYRAASGHFETIVDVEKDTKLPASILGERTLFLAVGDVDAVVDFRGLNAGAVDVSSDRRSATITLPPPRFTDAGLDVDRSRVVDHDRGVLNDIGSVFGGSGSDRELYVLAERKLEAAARSDSGLLAKARVNTTDVLEGLLTSLGFRRVTVRFESAPAL